MPERVTPVRVFISSPGDLFPERDIIKHVVEELNRSPRYLDRYKLIPYAYEDSTPALVGAEPQAVVDQYLLRPEAADIFVCMLWLRMGTPTKDLVNPDTVAPYQSGTEYELLTAYRASLERGWPKILLYRCMRSPEDIDTLDPEQYSRVKGLFARFRAGGDLRGLIGEFRTTGELAQTARRDIEHLLELDLPALKASAPEQPTIPRPVFFVPSNLPSGYVERTQALDSLRKALLGSRETVGVVAAAALHGLGGLGKTVLARAICDDPAVRGAFPDGVLWATLGQNAEPARHQRDWIGALGGDVTAASSLASGKVELGRVLAERAVLLVLDDVWNADDADWLRTGGPRCGVLITTRDASQAEGAALVELELMQRNESRALLHAASARQLDDTQADTIAERLGHLPLALKTVGAMVARRIPWADIAEALDEGDLAFLGHGQRSVLAAIKASVDHLPQDGAARYRELVIFPQDEPLSESAVARLWTQTAGLRPRQSRRIQAELRECALIQADNTLHDLQHDYLRAQVPHAEQQSLHSALANSLSDPATEMPASDDEYGWQRLAYHLAWAERNDDLRDLLHNGAYLQGKIARLGTAALLEDFRLLPRDEESARMAGALRLGAPVLDQAPGELENQLFGRLPQQIPLHNLAHNHLPAFRLISHTLIPQGGDLIRMLEDHPNIVHHCALSPDGERALAAFDDRIWIWDVQRGQRVRELAGHIRRVTGCTYSPDGRLVASSSADLTLRIWHSETGSTYRQLDGHTDAIRCCAFSRNGQWLVSGADDHSLRIWAVEGGQTIQILSGHTSRVLDCSFSSDDQFVLSASGDGTLRLWHVASGSAVKIFRAAIGSIDSCALSANGRYVLSTERNQIRLWDATTGETLRILEGHTARVHRCAISPDGTRALSASADRTLRLWDLSTGQTRAVLRGHTEPVFDCVFGPDGNTALSASNDRTVRLWRIEPERIVPVSEEDAEQISEGSTEQTVDCTFNADGSLALSVSTTRHLHVWDTATRQILHTLASDYGINRCIFSPDGHLVMAALAENYSIRVWDWKGNKIEKTLIGHTSYVNGCAFSPNGKRALSASADHTLRLWDVDSGQTIRVLVGHDSYVNTCAFSPDGTLALSTSADHGHTCRIWDLESGQTRNILVGHTSHVMAGVFSPNGKLCLTAAHDLTLRLWDAANGSCLHVFRGHTRAVWDCAFSSDNRHILSVSADRTLRLWDVVRQIEITRWHADALLRCCAFHPDGRHVITGDSLGNLHWLRTEGVEV